MSVLLLPDLVCGVGRVGQAAPDRAHRSEEIGRCLLQQNRSSRAMKTAIENAGKPHSEFKQSISAPPDVGPLDLNS